jgi:hypothetical protein
MNRHLKPVFFNREEDKIEKSSTFKRSSLNLDNLSTTGNLKSFPPPTSGSNFRLSNRKLDSDNIRSSIKQELLVKIEPQLNKLSPTNKKLRRRLSIFEEDVEKVNNLNNKDLKNRSSFASSQSSINNNLKPTKLTKSNFLLIFFKIRIDRK